MAEPGPIEPGEAGLPTPTGGPGEAPPPADDAAGEAATAGPPSDDSALAAAQLSSVLADLAALRGQVSEISDATAEIVRLRARDTDLITRLHEDVTRLRTGEIALALNPVVTGMIKLHDQMVSLGALNDPASPVGMLHTQLLQIMELTCSVRPFAPAAGDRFDPAHHTGTRRVATTDPAADGTIAGTVKVGFARADGSIVRVAEVEVHRLPG